MNNRYARSSYWLGLRAEHPDIHPQLNQLRSGMVPQPVQQALPTGKQPSCFGQGWNEAQLHEVRQVDVIIPCNSGVIGGIIRYEKETYPVNISFHEFREQVSARMGVTPAEASIGFRFRYNLNVVSQRSTTRYEELRTEARFRKIIGEMVKKLSNARTRRVVLELSNMVSSLILMFGGQLNELVISSDLLVMRLQRGQVTNQVLRAGHYPWDH